MLNRTKCCCFDGTEWEPEGSNKDFNFERFIHPKYSDNKLSLHKRINELLQHFEALNKGGDK